MMNYIIVIKMKVVQAELDEEEVSEKQDRYIYI
jgi:hypothetical protein